MDKKDEIIQKFYGQEKPKKWDDDFDKLENVSVNDIKQMMEDYAQCVLADVSVSCDKGYELGYKDATNEAFEEIEENYKPNER